MNQLDILGEDGVALEVGEDRVLRQGEACRGVNLLLTSCEQESEEGCRQGQLELLGFSYYFHICDD
jgi:hypothetical protein